MTQYFIMHTQNPQPRLIGKTVHLLRKGALIAYPTDSSYAFGCAMSNKEAFEIIKKLKKLESKHPMTLICSDISEVSAFSLVNDVAFKYLKQLTPGPYTFILPASKMVPRVWQGGKRKTVGVRIPDNNIARALATEMEEPILSSTLWLPGEDSPVSCPHDIPRDTCGRVDLVLDGGKVEPFPTTVVDLVTKQPKILRVGAGSTAPFE